MSESVLSVQHLSFSYINQEKILFSDTTISFPGGWTAVAGPNGSGKSTLLQILGGRITPDKGEMKKLLIAIALEKDIPHKSILLLDEPVNHLDAESCSVLEEALFDYPGAVILVSHNREFLQSQIMKHWHLEKLMDNSHCSNNS
ncbi:ATP-binding cassette domain-containing protein [Spirochaeta isovalerica]|uniref:ATPase subunit of ABC transporter with duplicated ATPase domains n=1 Tax=Spirochaeta isovalerica TaxID=150 RepID=A0A841RC20_9SPIO|nr:ATP-binding cassette domain-containing protein [Spirochaeta isovalerica]MBB6480921.1 ATPase subunit of ABC transporter with duplicated ATPase domains [Spirochaeta isovalerica]